jgi:hypothetical protein
MATAAGEQRRVDPKNGKGKNRPTDGIGLTEVATSGYYKAGFFIALPYIFW